MSTVVGVSAIGVRPPAGTWLRAAPSATVTSPSGVVTTVTLAFTYSSPVGRTQYSYQYQIRTPDGTTTLYDSGTVVSTASSGISIPYVFAGGSQYLIYVRVADLFDTSDWTSKSFTVDTQDVSDYPDLPSVGSIYEIGINGVGYMLADSPQKPIRRQVGVLQAPRFATGDTPFTEAIERYTFLGFSSWKGGDGQDYLFRPDSNDSKYMESKNINPFEDGLSILPDVKNPINDNFATPYMVVASGKVFMVTANGELSSRATVDGATTTFTITGAVAPTSMASDGYYWYYADGANVFRNNAAADPVTAWSTLNAELVRWCVDRIAVTYVDGSSNIVVSTLDGAGAEEVAGGRFKYPNASVDINDITAGDGYLWFIVNRSDVSQIHYWKLGSADTYAAIGFSLPAGQKATQLGYYLGNLFIRAIEPIEGGGSRAIIYRCIPNDGVLVAERVLDWEDTFDNSIGPFAGDDRFVLFGWKQMDSDNVTGVGCIDLSTGGWSRWIRTSSSGDVYGVALWNGRLAIASNAIGLSVEKISSDSGPLESPGILKTSIADFGSSLTKVFDQIEVTFDPLPTGGQVDVYYTIDGGQTYTLVGSATTAGQTLIREGIEIEARSIGFRLNITGTTVSPVIRTLQLKLHPRTISDGIVQFPVNCSDNLSGLNGQPLPGNAPGAGMKRLRTLEALMGTRVRLQDVDWPVTQAATIWELVSIDTEQIGTFNSAENRRVDSAVATLTLRRAM